jgi:preprotein translocase subunit SecF
MSKWWKITLYVILILAIIAVVWLMFWNTNPNIEIQNDTTIETLTWENVEVIPETVDNETPTFEEDVMNDLEWFFENNKGYEDIEWEYWFTNPEN